MSTSLKIAVLGAGLAGRLHVAAISQTSGLEIAGVADITSSLAADLANPLGVALYASPEDLFNDDAIDGVVIATPEATHLDLAHCALEAGKHVLVEKPVANDPALIHALKDRANELGLLAVPGHNYAYLPECARLIKQAQRGELGIIRSLHIHYAIRHSEELASRYDGVLSEVLVHHAYLALAILGRPDGVHGGTSATAWLRLTSDDQAWMVWEYDGGSLAMLYATFAVDDLGPDPWTFTVKALGTQGTASFTWRSFTTRKGPFEFGIPLYEDTYVHQAAAFRDAILGVARPLSTLEDAATAARIIHTVANRP